MDELNCPLLICPVVASLLEEPYIIFGDPIAFPELVKADQSSVYPEINCMDTCVKIIGHLFNRKILFIFH